MSEILTESDFRHYCAELESAGGDWIPMEQFFKETDIESHRKAREWWPNDAPPALRLPPLTTFAEARRIVPGMVGGHSTFEAMLNACAQRCTQWLQMEGRDTQYPNETPGERKARKNREAQARFRDKGKSNDPQAAERAAHRAKLYEEYLELCRERKRVEADFKERIRIAYNAYMDAPK